MATHNGVNLTQWIRAARAQADAEYCLLNEHTRDYIDTASFPTMGALYGPTPRQRIIKAWRECVDPQKFANDHLRRAIDAWTGAGYYNRGDVRRQGMRVLHRLLHRRKT